MLAFEAVLGGLPGALKLLSLLLVPVFGLVIRRKWRLAAASREEVRRLVMLAAEDADRAEIEAAKEYGTRIDYELPPSGSFSSSPNGKSMCAVCYKPTTMRCSRCKSIKYCSGKCQIIHWRQGHKEECRPPAPHSRPKDKTNPSLLGIRKDEDASSSSSLFESCSWKEDEISVHLGKERVSSVDLNDQVPKVEVNEDHPISTSSSDSSPVSTSSTCSTFTVPSETTDDASFEGSPSRRGHANFTADAKSTTSVQELNMPLSRASSEAYFSGGDFIRYRLEEVSDSQTKEDECQPHHSKEPSSIDRNEANDDHLSLSPVRTVSSLPSVSMQLPVYQSIQPKGNLPKSKSVSAWDFTASVPDVENSRADPRLKPREVGSASIRVSDKEYSSRNHAAAYTRLSGMTSSISKVVQHLKPSKISGNEIVGKHISRVVFSYDAFVKLYNDKVEMRPFGLMNCGNSCYANVVLQCLTFTRPLSAYLLQGVHGQSCSKSRWCFTCELEGLVLRAKRGESVLSPANIMSELHKIGAHLGHGREEDAHEFLRYAVEAIQSSSDKTPEAAFMRLVFGGYIRSKVKCMNCQSQSARNERMMDLTVEIPGDIQTLQEALTRFTATEVLDGENRYECSRCKSYQKAKKRFKVLHAPNILTITLKRFQSGKFGKLNKAVAFPESLNMAEYMSSSSRRSDKSPIYQLYAVVVHLDIMNAAFSGHYVCYVRSALGKWYEVDDSMVKPVEVDKVLSKTAYMLFYARRSPRNTVAAANGDGRPKSAIGDDLLKAPPRRSERKKVPAGGSDSSDGYSSLFSSSPSDGGSCSTESTRFSSSTDDGGLWTSPARFSDDSDGAARIAADPESPHSGYSASDVSSSGHEDGGYQTQTLNYGHRRHGSAGTAFLDSDVNRDIRKLTFHSGAGGGSRRSSPPSRTQSRS